LRLRISVDSYPGSCVVTFSGERRNRYSIRLKDFDYSQEGAYFITICVQGRRALLGDIREETILLSRLGEIVKLEWLRLPQRFGNLVLDEFVIMPNHIHGIIIINRRGESCIRPDDSMGDHKDHPYGTETNSVGRIIQAYKSITTNRYILGVKKNNWRPFPRRLWQRNYYDHIIRNEDDSSVIREYIVDKPLNWEKDEENKEK
jgi:putative transposase